MIISNTKIPTFYVRFTVNTSKSGGWGDQYTLAYLTFIFN